DDDVALKPEEVAQREQLFLGGVIRGVFALRRERKLGGGAEDMTMRIDRARGRLEPRLGGIEAIRFEIAVGGHSAHPAVAVGNGFMSNELNGYSSRRNTVARK